MPGTMRKRAERPCGWRHREKDPLLPIMALPMDKSISTLPHFVLILLINE